MDLKSIAEAVATGFEVVGVALLIIGAIIALVRYGSAILRHGNPAEAYRGLRRNLGSAILLGLEFLVAADIIRTVAVAPTLQSVAALGLVVVVRTFLSWSLEVEIEGQWPWQRASSRRGAADQDEEI